MPTRAQLKQPLAAMWAAVGVVAHAAVLAVLLWTALPTPSHAQPAPPADPVPARVKELLDLLADPGVRDWLAKPRTAAPVPPPADTQAMSPAPGSPASGTTSPGRPLRFRRFRTSWPAPAES